MSRYFARLSYKGTAFCGWQRQNNGLAVQQVIEDTLSKVAQQKITITGCGRTDAGVHGKNYIAHFDFPNIDVDLLYKLNRMVGDDIVIQDLIQVDDSAHARYDATSRSYIYMIKSYKDPFLKDGYYYNPHMRNVDHEKLNTAAKLILDYDEFFPFCKTHTDVQTMICHIKECYWSITEDGEYSFNITANRFLRGMVRMIVGMCLHVAAGKYDIKEVIDALDNQRRLTNPWSVPACGLYFTNVTYPYI